MTPCYLRESRAIWPRVSPAFVRLRRHVGQFIAGILASGFCLGACAAPSSPRLEAARELVKEIGVKPMHDMFQAECVKEGDKSDATELFETHPAPFGGLSPESAYWPEVEGIFRRQRLRVCQAFTVEQLADALASQIAARLPAKGLSPGTDLDSVDRALREIVSEAIPAALASAEQSMDTAREKFTEMMAEEVTAIVECYQRNPK